MKGAPDTFQVVRSGYVFWTDRVIANFEALTDTAELQRGWARIASLIGTCKLNGVEPFTYMTFLLEALAAGHPQARIDELMPWNHKPSMAEG